MGHIATAPFLSFLLRSGAYSLRAVKIVSQCFRQHVIKFYPCYVRCFSDILPSLAYGQKIVVILCNVEQLVNVSYGITFFLVTEMCVQCSFNLRIFLLSLAYHLRKVICLVNKSDCRLSRMQHVL